MPTQKSAAHRARILGLGRGTEGKAPIAADRDVVLGRGEGGRKEKHHLSISGPWDSGSLCFVPVLVYGAF